MVRHMFHTIFYFLIKHCDLACDWFGVQATFLGLRTEKALT